MTYVPDPTQVINEDTVLENDGFFCDMSLDDFRKSMNIGPDFDDPLALNRLTEAIFYTNDLLTAWKQDQLNAGFQTIEDIATPSTGGLIKEVFFYKQAVFTYARAQLIETRRDISTTDKGHDRADDLDATIADYYRKSHEAIQTILGKTRITVGLI